ncbi:MAG: molybdopterin adenylyltransferase [Euryarchaeota archaeon]|nr:molybdopterin adenylyltransferase [Euryarchaeota archaeon]
MAEVRIGIVTVSDRASAGIYEDRSGPEIHRVLEKILITEWSPIQRVIPDEKEMIESTLISLCDVEGCTLIVTTGGTGPSLRDVTPEATESVCDRMMPGYGELMRAISLRHVPTAVLSRQTAGLRGTCLIVNLPGSPKAINETLPHLFESIPACIDLMEGPFIDTDPEHVVAFRPNHK